MTSFHYALRYRYKCRNGAGQGMERVVLDHPLTSKAEARLVLLKCASVIRCTKNEPHIKPPWPQVTEIVPTDENGRPLNQEDI